MNNKFRNLFLITFLALALSFGAFSIVKSQTAVNVGQDFDFGDTYSILNVSNIEFSDGSTQGTAFDGSSQILSSGNVSSGEFGSNTGGGNYTFPNNLTVDGYTITSRIYREQLSFGADSSGWWRIARLTGNNGRGQIRLVLHSTGGSGSPTGMDIIATAPWSGNSATITVNHLTNGSPINGVRIVNNSTDDVNYIEINTGTHSGITVKAMPDFDYASSLVGTVTKTDSLGGDESVKSQISVSGLTFGVGTGDGSNQFSVTSNGNVYIGGQLDMSTNKIVNLDTPTNNADAATKSYVDSAISDTEGGIYWNANGNHIYNTNSANVGVGTNSPGSKLQVEDSSQVLIHALGTFSGNNTIRVERSGNSIVDLVAGSSGYGGGLITDGYELVLTTNNDITNPNFYVGTNGNVGIGDSSPSQKLSVSGNVSATGYLYSSASTGDLFFNWVGGGIRRITDQGGVSNFTDSSMILHAGDNGNSLVSDLGITSGTTSENLYATADAGVYVITNRQSSYESAHTFSFFNSGNLAVPGVVSASPPTANNHLATKSYVDSSVIPDTDTTCDGSTCNVTNTGTLDGFNASSFILDYTPGNWEVASNVNDDVYSAASLELKEYNNAGAQTGSYTEAPSLSFHWGGRVASQIMMGTSGDIEIRNNPGTGYETLRARDYKVAGTPIIDSSRNIVDAGSGNFSGTVAVAPPTADGHAATKSYVDSVNSTCDGSTCNVTNTGTLDGYNAMEIAQLQSAGNINGGDANVLSDGWYGWKNSPPIDSPGQSYMSMVQQSDPSQKIQLAFGGSGSGKLFIRRADSGTFYNWTEFWSESNDGASSGLVAGNSGACSADGTCEVERIYSNRDGQSGNVIQIDHVENSNWPFIFKSSSVGNDNSSGFWVNSDGTPDMRLRATDSTVTALIHSSGSSYLNGGNVGIGTASPAQKLHVIGTGAGDGTWNQGILVENTNATAGEPAVSFKNSNTGSNYWITGINQTNAYDIAYGTSFTDGNILFTVGADGNVAIGKGDAASGVKLDVNGEISVNSNKITSLATPTADADAATKSYVDSTVIPDTDTTCDGSTCNVTNTGTLNGYSASEPNTGSTIAARDSAGDITARLFRPEYTTLNTGTSIAYFWTSRATGSQDNYLRPTTRAAVLSQLEADGINAATADNASNAGALDGIDSLSFLRSDANDSFSGMLTASAGNRQSGIYGTYSSTKIDHVWSMGTSYKIASDGSTFGNLYGLAYCHTNNANCTSGLGHQLEFVNNGTVGTAIGFSGGIWTSGSITGTQFIDQNNTSYYIDPGNSGTAGNFNGNINALGLYDSSAGDWGITGCDVNGGSIEDLCFIEPEQDNKIWGYIDDDVGLKMTGAPGIYASGNLGVGVLSTDAARYGSGGTTVEVYESSDSEIAQLLVQGNSQGTGYIYVGQSDTHGGGITYNGDDNPGMPQSTDNISIFRRTSGTDIEVLSWVHNSSIAEFRGNIDMNSNDITGVDKVYANSVDPVYNINGEKFATYMAGMTGLKEETTGTLKLEEKEIGKYQKVIDFNELEKGSDLWLFWQTTDFGNDWSNFVALLTPNFNGNVWYEKDFENKTITILANKEGEVSYRFTAPRFDYDKPEHGNSPDNIPESIEGLIIPFVK